jgi:hypothetical protein
MPAGVAGAFFTIVILCWLLVVPGHVVLLAVTVIKPCMKLLVEFTVIALVP